MWRLGALFLTGCQVRFPLDDVDGPFAACVALDERDPFVVGDGSRLYYSRVEPTSSNTHRRLFFRDRVP